MKENRVAAYFAVLLCALMGAFSRIARAVPVIAILFVALVVMAPDASAAVPVEITDLMTDIGTIWDSAKAIILGVAVFSTLLFFALKVRKRTG